MVGGFIRVFVAVLFVDGCLRLRLYSWTAGCPGGKQSAVHEYYTNTRMRDGWRLYSWFRGCFIRGWLFAAAALFVDGWLRAGLFYPWTADYGNRCFLLHILVIR
jgi:hypothetical protein